jgi:hypothetical protein
MIIIVTKLQRGIYVHKSSPQIQLLIINLALIPLANLLSSPNCPSLQLLTCIAHVRITKLAIHNHNHYRYKTPPPPRSTVSQKKKEQQGIYMYTNPTINHNA